MRTNRKADAANVGSKTNFTGGEIKAFSPLNYRQVQFHSQCPNCELRDLRIGQLERLVATLAGHIDELRTSERIK